ncbi:MAG: beta-propeller domain-containing protein [Bacillota bacterium]|nr:beta-propeller domain-containing protein [Bacillota bacterium]
MYDKLEQTGYLGGLAPGEHIYSLRFIGDRLYLVTYRDTYCEVSKVP